MKTTPKPGLRHTYVNLKTANWYRYRQEVETALSKRSLPTDCQRDEKIFRTILLKSASYHIPTGRHSLHEEPVPAEILDVMTSAHKPKQNGEILLITWTKRQILPYCGELSMELTEEQTARQKTKQYLQWNLILIVQAASRQVQ